MVRTEEQFFCFLGLMWGCLLTTSYSFIKGMIYAYLRICKLVPFHSLPLLIATSVEMVVISCEEEKLWQEAKGVPDNNPANFVSWQKEFLFWLRLRMESLFMLFFFLIFKQLRMELKTKRKQISCPLRWTVSSNWNYKLCLSCYLVDDWDFIPSIYGGL